MRMTQGKGWVFLALAGFLLLAVPVAGGISRVKASGDDLDKIEVGMSRAEVEKILGKPDRDVEVRDIEGLCRLYTYRKLGGYKLVNIWFDCRDKVNTMDKVR